MDVEEVGEHKFYFPITNADNLTKKHQLGGIHKGRPADPPEGVQENRTKTDVEGGGRVWGVRTSEIEKIILAHFSLFLLKIIYAYKRFSFLVYVSMISLPR